MQDHLPENYSDSVNKSSEGKNDYGNNPEVLLQTFAFDKSIIKSLYKVTDFTTLKVLDVGWSGNIFGSKNKITS